MRVKRIGYVAAAALAAISPVTAFAQTDDNITETRLKQFIDAGYDALSAPTDWYSPVRSVDGVVGQELPIADVEERTIPNGALEAAAAYAETKDSIALIVVRGGKVELERYWNGAGRDTRFNPQSMSKTLVALLTGIAIDEGEIGSVDDPLSKYVARVANDPRGDIALKDLLQMSAGLEQITTSGDLTMENRGVRQHFGPSFLESMFELQLVDEPGTKWDYNNNETIMMAHALSQATGHEYANYLSEKLWRPLGLPSAAMYLDSPDGQVLPSCCVLSRPIDWARVGMLVGNGGKHGGEQLVPQQWIEEMTTPAETWRGYGYQIWLHDRNVSKLRPQSDNRNLSWASESYSEDDMVVLVGHGFQRVWVMPSLDLVIVRAGRTWPENWDESVIPNLIARAIRDSEASD